MEIGHKSVEDEKDEKGKKEEKDEKGKKEEKEVNWKSYLIYLLALIPGIVGYVSYFILEAKVGAFLALIYSSPLPFFSFLLIMFVFYSLKNDNVSGNGLLATVVCSSIFLILTVSCVIYSSVAKDEVDLKKMHGQEVYFEDLEFGKKIIFLGPNEESLWQNFPSAPAHYSMHSSIGDANFKLVFSDGSEYPGDFSGIPNKNNSQFKIVSLAAEKQAITINIEKLGAQ